VQSDRPELRVLDGGRAHEWDEPERSPADGRSVDLKAEDAIIANILFDFTMLDNVRVFLKPEHFSGESRRRIYEAACALRDDGNPVDHVTVATWLRDHGRLAQVGGHEGITELLNAAPAYGPPQLAAYARSVRDKWVRRQLEFEARHTASRCQNDAATVEQLVSDARTKLDEMSQALVESERSSEVRLVLERTTRQLLAASTSEGRGDRPTGFDRLDRITAGLHSELVLLGARPGMGKTSLATAIAAYRASQGDGVYIASCETSSEELVMRMVCAESRVAIQRCRAGVMTPTDWSRITDGTRTFSNWSLWVDDTSAPLVSDLWAKVRRVAMQLHRNGKRMGLVVVDYVQLLKVPRANMKREEGIAENVRMLKAMAQELDCPVLALAQLNRQCENREDKRPQLSDLRESGELEQCARTVLLLYRADYYIRGDDARERTQEADVHVAKQNNGPTGLVKLRFDEECVRFDNIAEGY
jgi:replicative DNA helicase